MMLKSIDENLHSRQLAVYGREAMRRMAMADVLISGANGLGVEIAKNVILAGVRSVTIHDTMEVTLQDLSAQFYLTEHDVGANRAEACRHKLQELNTSVAVHAAAGQLTDEFVLRFRVVVCTSAPLGKAKQLDALCHAAGIAFIWTETRGVFARVFTDFGPNFTVLDVDGEDPHSSIIASVNAGYPALVTCVDDDRVQFEDGELVQFSEVVGMDRLNTDGPFKVTNCRAHSFNIDADTTTWGTYQRGGIAVQVKQPQIMAFRTLEQALVEPGHLMQMDFSKVERPKLLHVAFQALDALEAAEGRCCVAADATKLLSYAEEINAASVCGVKLPALDAEVVSKLAHCASAEINPMAALFGGIVGQEVIKALSGMFRPIFQWMYFDSLESLPNEVGNTDEYAPLGSRFDHQITVFGCTLQHRLAALKVLLVGAGALGCELLKNFACMGIACEVTGTNDVGAVTVTDDDIIEKSNLSRQFLFRDSDIGTSKSMVASKMAHMLNPGFHVRPLQNRVSAETEAVFDDNFWLSLDLVVNAVDNVNARLYVDSRCVYFGKPLLESGTLGPKCNTQVVIPHLTENYGASRDPPEVQAPMCTLHTFPYNIDHCLIWARSEFEDMLDKGPREATNFLDAPADYAQAALSNSDALTRQRLESVVDALVDNWTSSFEQCITWARTRFQDYFHNRIVQLTTMFPADANTSTGAPFWSAPKRFPRPLDFDPKNEAHAAFVQAAAILRAEVYGIPLPPWAHDVTLVATEAAKVEVPAFKPTAGEPTDDEAAIKALLVTLEVAQGSGDWRRRFRLSSITFEKDNDTNFHMDLIASMANLRAHNYSIPTVDKFKAKLIAGRIIPAIATATAVAAGLVCLELYKVVQSGLKSVESYRNTFINLALPLFTMAQPILPKVTKYNGMHWSLWDRWTLDGDLTVTQVMEWCKARGLEPYSISHGPTLLYSKFCVKHAERIDRKLSELVATIAKVALPMHRDHFDVVVGCNDDNDNEVDIPLISIKWR